nr:TniQ family protein [Gluconacetobacter tumulisoli]
MPGELLSSCLTRNAFAHGLSPYRFLNLIWDHDPVWNRDFDRDPETLLRMNRTPEARTWLDDIAERLSVPYETVIGATLTGWREVLGTNIAVSAADSRLILSAGIYHRTRTRHALQYCPNCLADGIPYFRREWRLGFSTWCSGHGRPLRDACPHCDAAVIPHRSMSIRLIDCHQCGRDLTKGGREIRGGPVPQSARRLQNQLLDLLAQADRRPTAFAWLETGRAELPLTVRGLIAASAPWSAYSTLREALGLAPTTTYDDADRRRFEHARFAVRTPWLETVAAWMENWPRNFFLGAEAIGASHRTFARCPMSQTLARQVAQLPARRKAARKQWKPILNEPVINRLRRTDRTAYSALRACRILHAIGVHTDA